MSDEEQGRFILVQSEEKTKDLHDRKMTSRDHDSGVSPFYDP